MKPYTIKLTRDAEYTQSVVVNVNADNKFDAIAEALAKGEENSQGFVSWEDDDCSFHFGENGVYIADPDEIPEDEHNV